MALSTPTVTQIDGNIINDLEASLGQSIPILPKAFIRVLAKALAGVFVMLYKYGGFIFLQMFVSTASDRETTINGQKVTPLLFWGRLIGVGDLTAATIAEFTITITVTSQTSSLAAGSQVVNADNGVTYITLAAVALNASTVTATIRAVSDQAGGQGAGIVGNLAIGSTVSFVAPIANINQDALIATQTVTGADGETFPQYRKRVDERFKKALQGGAGVDYESWGEEVAGIANIYPYTGASPGDVDVYVESSVSVDGIPNASELAAVLANINLDQNGLATRRPLTAFINTIAITRTRFDVDITGLNVSNSVIVQADIVTAITNFFLAREPFIDGLTIPPKTSLFTLNDVISTINDVVVAANGSFISAVFRLSSGGGNITFYTLGQGEKAKSGTVTFIS